METQFVESTGRIWLTNELIKAGFEVARPERDHGIDLIAYKDMDEFVAYPIQMKAANGEVFSIFPKYEKFPGLFFTYIWYVKDWTKTKCFALTYKEALHVADEMGWTKTDSWKIGGTTGKRGYTTTHPSKRLLKLITPYEMNKPEKWVELIKRINTKG